MDSVSSGRRRGILLALTMVLSAWAPAAVATSGAPAHACHRASVWLRAARRCLSGVYRDMCAPWDTCNLTALSTALSCFVRGTLCVRVVGCFGCWVAGRGLLEAVCIGSAYVIACGGTCMSELHDCQPPPQPLSERLPRRGYVYLPALQPCMQAVCAARNARGRSHGWTQLQLFSAGYSLHAYTDGVCEMLWLVCG